MSVYKTAYIEKYRPKTLDEVIGQEKIVASIKEIIQRRNISGEKPPHMLFKGPPGVGKTTVAHCIGRALFGENYKNQFFEFNASDTRKIDDIRDLIKPLSKTVSEKIIFFDEADGLTFESQQALRRIMEQAKTTIFILSVNNENKLHPALHSRCTPYYFNNLDTSAVGAMLRRVLEGEGIQLEKNSEEAQGLFQVIKLSNGDLRKALNILEKIVTSNKKLNVQSVLELKPIDQTFESMKEALSGNSKKAIDIIEDVFLKTGRDIDMVVDSIFEATGRVEDENIKMRLYYELGELEHRLQTTHRPLVQLTAFISFTWIAPRLSD